MKNILLLLALFSLIHTTSGQKRTFKSPDYKKIEKEIIKSDSNLFYAKLMERFLQADSTMTLEEKRHLYYGYSFNENYAPYGHSNFSDSLNVYLRKEVHTKKDLNTIVRLGDAILKEIPFELRVMNFQLYAYNELKEEEQYTNRLSQMTIILDALLSSGNGLNKKRAFYVIYTGHEYELLNILGYKFGGTQKLLDDHYDYLEIVENDSKIKGLYFEITPSLNSLSKMFNKKK